MAPPPTTPLPGVYIEEVGQDGTVHLRPRDPKMGKLQRVIEELKWQPPQLDITRPLTAEEWQASGFRLAINERIYMDCLGNRILAIDT